MADRYYKVDITKKSWGSSPSQSDDYSLENRPFLRLFEEPQAPGDEVRRTPRRWCSSDGISRQMDQGAAHDVRALIR